MDCPLGARGVPYSHQAAVIGTWLLAASAFVLKPHPITGVALGFSMCWIGLAIQHTANHGGLHKNPKIGYLLGLLNDVGPGGSSLVWRYHHQVSHHSYCNDVVLDQDAHSSFPLMRLEKSQKVESWHQYQWIYGPMAFSQLWASIHMQDFQCLLDARTFLVHMKGTSSSEIVLGLCLKFVHFSWFYFLPVLLHGFRAMLLPWACALFVGSFWLSALFIVSHNLVACKEPESPEGKGDWARYQIETSSSWGGPIGSFFTGGLNLQIEHHLFPGMAHHLYPQAQKIVKDECAKAGIRYTGYDYFVPNFVDHIKFLYAFGRQDKKAD
jgi:fatty acid desaturase (delta-4 desaturase)